MVVIAFFRFKMTLFYGQINIYDILGQFRIRVFRGKPRVLRLRLAIAGHKGFITGVYITGISHYAFTYC